jgi:hypothetical protein
MKEKEEKELYKERPDLVEALKGKYFRPFELSKGFDEYEHDSFAEIKSISERVGQREVKLILRLVSFGRSAKYSVITAETEFPWWLFKKNADDELTVDMVMEKMKKTQTREELVEFARKTLNQSLQVLEDMGITKAELLR